MVSPIGIGKDAFWHAALKGCSGVKGLLPFENLPLEGYRSKVVARVDDFERSRILSSEDSERVDRYAQFALAAAREAVRDAGLRMTRLSAPRTGVVVGAGMGGMVFGERELTRLYESRKPHRVHPQFIPTVTLNSASGSIAIAHGAKGPNVTVSTACSSGAHAIGQALLWLRAGLADAVITVGADASISPLVFAGFCALRTLSTSFNDTPSRASRPFTKDRDGFVLGEGAGALILETMSRARRRGAHIYAEVGGYAARSEAYHAVIPREDGSDIATTMKAALKDAQVSPSRVDYINAHATSTLIGDAAEVRAIRKLFKAHADRVPVNATKSLIGHTLGAAGTLGSIASILSIYTGRVHPTVNYDNPDPGCALSGIARESHVTPVNVALVNAFGFGSNNASIVLKRYRGN